jgi:hypothetical protein
MMLVGDNTFHIPHVSCLPLVFLVVDDDSVYFRKCLQTGQIWQ